MMSPQLNNELPPMTHTCTECRTAFTPRKTDAKFCSTPCRKDFNNRRAVRGAVLYDAFMAMRYDRKWASAIGLWQLICRMTAEWRAADERETRKSFVRPERWVSENSAWLRSKNCGHISIGRKS